MFIIRDQVGTDVAERYRAFAMQSGRNPNQPWWRSWPRKAHCAPAWMPDAPTSCEGCSRQHGSHIDAFGWAFVLMRSQNKNHDRVQRQEDCPICGAEWRHRGCTGALIRIVATIHHIAMDASLKSDGSPLLHNVSVLALFAFASTC